MKVRLFRSSVRFRVRKPDLETLLRQGSLTERLVVDPASGAGIEFRLELAQGIDALELAAQKSGCAIRVPHAMAIAWAASSEVGLHGETAWGVRLIVEKDFACLEPRPGEANDGTFPRPSGPDAAQCSAT
jgi:hypothetical protein